MNAETAAQPVASTQRLSPNTKFCYGVGHVLNDLCAAMWFTYLLVFFQGVLEFDSTKAGLVLLVGQLADGFSTPVVGFFSDKENKIPVCARYGRRKIWHLMGTIFVLVTFPFIFSPCIGCSHADQSKQIFYYCFFVVVFQFGWACVQISHLSLIPEITKKKHTRTELTSIRYAFTVLSTLAVYSIAFLLLNQSAPQTKEKNDTLSSTTTISYSELSSDSPPSSVSPEDAASFQNLSLFCIGAGFIFSAIFHFGVKEPEYKGPGKSNAVQSSEKGLGTSSARPEHMRVVDWFKEIAFYQVALLYMVTRLFINLYQVYIPMYVQYTLGLGVTSIATVPFAMYLAGFASSLVMKPINKTIGRKGTYSLGCTIGLIGCAAIAFDQSEAYRTWGIYLVGALLGIGGSTVLITSLSITSDLIGSNVEGGAFVYGFMSLTDKISNGIIIMLIQNAIPEDKQESNPFYQQVIIYACGSCCLIGILVALSLIPVKVGQRRGVAKKVAALVEEESEDDHTFKNLKAIEANSPSTISTISKETI